MGKIFNDVHFSGELDFSLGKGLGAIMTSGLFNKKQPASFKDRALNTAISMGSSALRYGKNAVSNIADHVSESAPVTILRDRMDATNSRLIGKFTRNGQADARLSDLLHPKNNNGIPLETKLELSKLNVKLKTSGVPERHIEKATLMYIDALQASGDDVVSKQFYLTTLRDCGVSGEHIVKCIQLSLGPTAANWLKIAAAIGLTLYVGKKVVTSELAKTAANLGKYAVASIAKPLLKGAVRIIK